MSAFASTVARWGRVLGGSAPANLDTTRVADEGNTRTVMIVAALLVVAALVLIAVTIWFWKNTVPDPDALESLTFFEERIVDSADDVDHEVVVVRRRTPRVTLESTRGGLLRTKPRDDRRRHDGSAEAAGLTDIDDRARRTRGRHREP